jgi:hypothetical protein
LSWNWGITREGRNMTRTKKNQVSVTNSTRAINRDIKDYRDLVSDYGVRDYIKSCGERTDDLIDREPTSFRLYPSPSRRGGVGLFAQSEICRGAFIAHAKLGGKRCAAGRFTNHSIRPNAEFVGDATMMALRDIGLGEEVTVNYRESPTIKRMMNDGYPVMVVPDPRFMAPTPSKQDVIALQEKMLELPQTLVTVDHFIHAGMYSRTAFIPAGVMGVGVEWCQDNIVILVGDITVTTDEGVIRMRGHNILKANSGIKRVLLAHQDTYFTAIFTTKATDVFDAETELSRECDFMQTRMG